MKRAVERGLTLIEVLVAIAIFTIVSVAISAMFPTIFKLNRQAGQDQAVTVAAKQVMEQVRVAYTDTTKDASGQTKFESGYLPPMPATTTVNGYTCTGTSVDQPVVVGATSYTGMMRRITLSCTRSDDPTYTYTLDLGNPSL